MQFWVGGGGSTVVHMSMQHQHKIIRSHYRQRSIIIQVHMYLHNTLDRKAHVGY